MSHWSTIQGTLTIDEFSGVTQPEIDYIIRSTLQSLPDVNPSFHAKPTHYQSEHHFDIFLNYSSLNRASCTHDDNQVYAGHRTYNLENKNRFVPNYNLYSNTSKMLETCTTCIVTVDGLFRDAFFEDTLRDFMNWLLRLSTKLYIDGVCVRVGGDRLNNHDEYASYIITDKDCYFGERYQGNEFAEVLIEESRRKRMQREEEYKKEKKERNLREALKKLGCL